MLKYQLGDSALCLRPPLVGLESVGQFLIGRICQSADTRLI